MDSMNSLKIGCTVYTAVYTKRFSVFCKCSSSDRTMASQPRKVVGSPSKPRKGSAATQRKRPEMPTGLVDMQVKYHLYQYGRKALEPEVHNIKLYLSDTVEFTMMHIKRSLGFSGRLTINGSYVASKSKNKLREYLQSGTQKMILELESFSTLKKNSFPTPLTVVIDSKTAYQKQLSVQHTTTLQEVQHQIQNEIGVPIKEQQLFFVAEDNSSKTPTRLTDRVVNFYKHGFKGLQLMLPRRHALGSTSKSGFEEKDTSRKDNLKEASTSTMESDEKDIANEKEDLTDPSIKSEAQSGPAEGDSGSVEPDSEAPDVFPDSPAKFRNIPDCEITEYALAKITQKLVSWEPLARELGTSQADIVVITRNNPDYKEQKFKALYQWKMCVGKKARWRALLLACRKAGDKNLADQLPDIYIESLQRTPEKVMKNDIKTEDPQCPHLSMEEQSGEGEDWFPVTPRSRKRSLQDGFPTVPALMKMFACRIQDWDWIGRELIGIHVEEIKKDDINNKESLRMVFKVWLDQNMDKDSNILWGRVTHMLAAKPKRASSAYPTCRSSSDTESYRM